MKLSRDKERELTWDAIFKAAGDREKACRELGITDRTLSRRITEYDLHHKMEAMHWKARRGPAPGVSRGSSIIRMYILAHIKKHRGGLIISDMAKKIYGESSQSSCNRIIQALEDMVKDGTISFDGETYRVLDKTG